MIRTITTALLLLLLVTPTFAQSSHADADAITTASLNNEFDNLKASFDTKIPLGIKGAMQHREQLRGSQDIFLLDDANTLLIACVALEDTLAQVRAEVDSYKDFLKGKSSLQVIDASRAIHSRISMPRQFTIPEVLYESANDTELEAINGLQKCRIKMEFVLEQMRKKLRRANELLAYQNKQE
jgi:hypothetical protein